MKCKICDTRKPRRYCPGVGGDICPICCGEQREVTVNCPLDCPFLREARVHEKPRDVEPEEVPNRDIRVTEEFLRDHETLLIFLGMELLQSALSMPGTIDSDIQQALESLIRTHRTLQSGLYYETRPDNLVAAAIQQKVQDGVEHLRKELSEKGASSIRDADILGMLVFLQRIALHQDNGRPKGRAFIDYLRAYFSQDDERPESAPSLIQV
ncbi:MAG TPA: hypothetical protein VEU96_31945 [Bryobacteraceae bacterium]|nr:hypothetical protein [Bryobacteraceae bacterium]